MELAIIIVLSIALTVCAGAWFMIRSAVARNASRSTEEAELQIRSYEQSTSRLLEETRRQYEQQIFMLERRLESQQAEMENRLAKREEEMKRQSALEFSNLASSLLSRESDHLRASNRTDIDAILTPLRERLTEFQHTIRENHIKDNESRAALSSQIESLAHANTEIGRETRRLSNALKGDTRLQGQWGETVLDRILDQAGLVEGIHYTLQATNIDGRAIRTDEGETYRPDLLLMLPGGHKIVVDSKTSLTDYLRYVEASDEKESEQSLRRHAASVRRHVKELADKQYHRHIPGAMEHSLMFIPNDASFIAAVRGDVDLPEYAFKNNVVMVSPAHILSIIQMIAQIWRVERQNHNAEAIAEAGGKLYDKFTAFLTDFEKIERNLQLSLKAYESSLNHITGGRQSLSARAERLRNLGAKVSKRIPESMLPGETGSEEK